MDFSQTPLATKLGIDNNSVLALVHAPSSLPLVLPESVVVRHNTRGHADVALAFFSRATSLRRQFDGLARLVFPAGGLWIAWPKRSSGHATDLSDHAVRDIALPLGLVDNKVCAIDDTWTALRVVWRLSLRTQ